MVRPSIGSCSLSNAFFPLFIVCTPLLHSQARSNIKNTVTCMKLLVGRTYTDPEVQEELKRFAYKTSAMANGGVGINLMYNDEEIVVPVEHVMAMMLTKAREVVNGANGNAGVADVVLAVPANYTDAQRRGVMRACEIASLNCLKVANETTAIALSYGIFKSAKKLFSETEKTYVMFVDLGYTTYSVTVVEFMQEHMKVLSTVVENGLGGRDYDKAVVEFLVEQFKAKTKLDISDNKKALLKLHVAGEKAKKFLSPDGVVEAPVNVECLAEETDLNCILTKEEFETRTQHLNDRLKAPIDKAMDEAGLQYEQLNEVEIVGGALRVPAVKKVIGEACHLNAEARDYGLKTTMNADEAVARGTALQCAMLSSRIRVKAFNVVDRLYYGVKASYDSVTTTDSSEDGKEAEGGTTTSSGAQLYQRGDEVPHKPRRLTFRKKTTDFTISLTYDDTYPGLSKNIGTYLVKVPEGVPPQDVRVTFNLDKNGCVYVQSAEMLQEIVEEEAPAPAAAEPAPAPPAAEGDAAAAEPAAAPAEGEGKEGEGKEAEAKDEAKATADEKKDDKAANSPPKKRFRKTDLDVMVTASGLTPDEVKSGIELEASMAFEDRMIIETADKRNEVEAYVYNMRDKLDRELKPYAEQAESDDLKSALMSTEEWLYDEFEATKSQLQGKLDEVQSKGNTIERRRNEDQNRQGALDGLSKQIELCRAFTKDYDEKYAHITEEEREKLRTCMKTTEDWMHDKMLEQGGLPKTKDPVLTCQGIQDKRSALFQISNPIMTKKAPPPPKPAPAPAAAPPAPAPEAKDDGAAPEGDAKKADADADAAPAAEGEAPMDTEEPAPAAAEGGDAPTEMDTSV